MGDQQKPETAGASSRVDYPVLHADWIDEAAFAQALIEWQVADPTNHDPGDEDPAEAVKRALLPLIAEVSPSHAMSTLVFRAWVTPGQKVIVRPPALDVEDLL